jgi:hypothetical protein
MESQIEAEWVYRAKGLAGSTFVGRQREMDELQSALDDARSGQGRLVMLAGEPGIGKTRTARELASYAETRGIQVLWGWCYEEAGAPPYWPWVQPLRSYIHQQDSDQLRSQMGAGAADIAEIIPELREKLPGLEPPLALEPEQARFRLFDSITPSSEECFPVSTLDVSIGRPALGRQVVAALVAVPGPGDEQQPAHIRDIPGPGPVAPESTCRYPWGADTRVLLWRIQANTVGWPQS